jgi:glycosyltransferase involved in cell wall biosynthesis
MKIGIIGTRGIPNQYGGFEQFLEFTSPILVERGYEVHVYNSSLHPFEGDKWKGVHIVKKFDPEDRIGTVGQFIYDFGCILDARKKNYDILLQLGYTSSSIWSFLFPRKSIIITNMDGLEWKRSKYNALTQRFLKYAEKIAVNNSNHLIADSKGIQSYLSEKYGVGSSYIAYGATIFSDPDKNILEKYGLVENTYNLIIARMEPENNIETILKGHLLAKNKIKLLIIGNYKNKYGTYLKAKYQGEGIHFMGPIYDLTVLNNLRYFSNMYFHGHSVGGTNPSLLEAMASNCLLVAHDNIFNRSVLEEDAYYFKNEEDISGLLNAGVLKEERLDLIGRNAEKIKAEYTWGHIADLLINLFENAKPVT